MRYRKKPGVSKLSCVEWEEGTHVVTGVFNKAVASWSTLQRTVLVEEKVELCNFAILGEELEDCISDGTYEDAE
jgi:hypothetical protein